MSIDFQTAKKIVTSTSPNRSQRTGFIEYATATGWWVEDNVSRWMVRNTMEQMTKTIDGVQYTLKLTFGERGKVSKAELRSADLYPYLAHADITKRSRSRRYGGLYEDGDAAFNVTPEGEKLSLVDRVIKAMEQPHLMLWLAAEQQYLVDQRRQERLAAEKAERAERSRPLPVADPDAFVYLARHVRWGAEKLDKLDGTATPKQIAELIASLQVNLAELKRFV